MDKKLIFLPTQQKKSKFNRPLYGIAGKYTLSHGVGLPYFLCSMEIDRAIEELRIVEQIDPSLDTKWSLNELFQREIDEERVEDEIIRGYLLDKRKLKFFNAITIVLMPKDSSGIILDSFPGESPDLPPIPYETGNEYDAQWGQEGNVTTHFGGVQYTTIGTNARLRWNEDSVLPVAVDGQHRLWALRKFREDPSFRGGKLQAFEAETNIPVIFVLLHPNVGFSNAQEHNTYTVRGVARELFTDLNKNAKTVDRARRLILDDKSIEALCVRTLITKSTDEDLPNKLPLTLIRWQDANNRFDQSYYLNSIVHLELTVSAMVTLKLPTNPMDKGQVSAFIKSIKNAFGDESNQLIYRDRDLDKYYKDEYCDQDQEGGEPHTPFARLPEQYLTAVVEGFERKFHPWMTRLLLEFKPYKSFLQIAREKDLIRGVFGKFQAQTEKHKGLLKEQFKTSDDDWHYREIQTPSKQLEEYKKDQWAFKTIWQKAMLRLGRLVAFEYKGDPNLGTIDDVLKFLDRLYDSGLLKVYAKIPAYDSPFYLWTFIALNPGNQKIRVAQSVEDRIFSLLSLWYYGSRMIEVGEKNGTLFPQTGKEILKKLSQSGSTAHWPNCADLYKKILECINIAGFHGQDGVKQKESTKEEKAKQHFQVIFAAGLPTLNQPIEDPVDEVNPLETLEEEA